MRRMNIDLSSIVLNVEQFSPDPKPSNSRSKSQSPQQEVPSKSVSPAPADNSPLQFELTDCKLGTSPLSDDSPKHKRQVALSKEEQMKRRPLSGESQNNTEADPARNLDRLEKAIEQL